MEVTAEIKNMHFELDEREKKIVNDFWALAYRIVVTADIKGLDVHKGRDEYVEGTFCDKDYNLFIAARDFLDIMHTKY